MIFKLGKVFRKEFKSRISESGKVLSKEIKS